MGPPLQDQQQRNHDKQPRWDRRERADLFAPDRAWQAQGISERQAAKKLKVPRTTLQAWRLWHTTLDICPQVAAFFQSGPGLAGVHRRVVGFHVVCLEGGACGMRLACLVLTLTGLDRFVPLPMGRNSRSTARLHQRLRPSVRTKPHGWPRTCPAKTSPSLRTTRVPEGSASWAWSP